MNVDFGLNLYIDITTACNARCDFCIAPTVGRQNGSEFFNGLYFALDFIFRHNGSVQIVGGEPMISNRLDNVLNEIGFDDYHRVVLNTNGSFITVPRVASLVNAGVDWVNISRHHFNEKINQTIMGIAPFLSNADLSKAISMIGREDIGVRLNANLIDGYIDSGDAMRKYITWAKSIGAPLVSFSQLFPLGLFDYQIPPAEEYTESKQVDLVSIVDSFDRDPRWQSVSASFLHELVGKRVSAWGGGSNWYTPVGADNPSGKRRYWTNGESVFSIKTLSGYSVATGLPNKTTYSTDADDELNSDRIYFIVLHPDGVVTASWDKRERILFNPYASNIISVYQEIIDIKT